MITRTARTIRTLFLVAVACAVGLYIFHISPAARAGTIVGTSSSPIAPGWGHLAWTPRPAAPVITPPPTTERVCIKVRVTHRHGHRHIKCVRWATVTCTPTGCVG